MKAKVDLYDGAYGNYEAGVYRAIREETYGEDLGQTSWVTSEESAEIMRWLELTRDSNVLEIGCGSGRYALHVASKMGCRVTGIDLNEPGIERAKKLAEAEGLGARVRFENADASKKLRFAEDEFDAVFSNDVLCHIPGRDGLLRELCRVLKSGGRILFSDALIVGGVVSQEEIASRSLIGYYLFSPPGENERLMQKAGLRLRKAMDTTENASAIAGRWHAAREKRTEALVTMEGQDNFAGLQRFLASVEKLNRERRLLRMVYLAEKA
ncbi:MAG TPA: methyltransferase domain-containing protein [Candidatus Acidoferrum sp.]|nr:methyltransferase domain-containing protein [Candidatus Acidoferrum sp.]